MSKKRINSCAPKFMVTLPKNTSQKWEQWENKRKKNKNDYRGVLGPKLHFAHPPIEQKKMITKIKIITVYEYKNI